MHQAGSNATDLIVSCNVLAKRGTHDFSVNPNTMSVHFTSVNVATPVSSSNLILNAR